MSCTLMSFQLENLRTQYEAQVQALRLELERERGTQLRHGDGIHRATVMDDGATHDTDKVQYN